jgi:hypothetical protein
MSDISDIDIEKTQDFYTFEILKYSIQEIVYIKYCIRIISDQLQKFVSLSSYQNLKIFIYTEVYL